MGRFGNQPVAQPVKTVSVTTQFDKTSSGSLADIPGLSVNVIAGNRYGFEAVLYTTSNVAGGVQSSIRGTCVATNVIFESIVTDSGALKSQIRGSTLGVSVGSVTAVTAANIIITGSILVATSGTLTVQFAQNSSNAAASSVLVGSHFKVFTN